ncbi:MAG: PadR family transcriptional regulator [Gammaproteobacteria bacterium]|nr:PadR family transcriptional regulator [Gammaproteobacteria bacterium]
MSHPAAKTAAPASLAQATRMLMVLGVLHAGARHGYELHRILVAHGTVYADFKKPTLYHLLARLAAQGAVDLRSETGARGPRGERLVYSITAQGRALFQELLRSVLGSYDENNAGFQVAAGFLAWIPVREAQALLRQRCIGLRSRQAEIHAAIDQHVDLMQDGAMTRQQATSRFLSADHLLNMMDAELAWMEKTIAFLDQSPHKALVAAVNSRRRAAGE